jgi:hypothetical protein
MTESNFETGLAQQQIQKDERIKIEKINLPLIEHINEKLSKGDVIDWENYRQTLPELLYRSVIKEDEEDIKKICLQVKQFELLKMKHEKGISNGIDQREGVVVNMIDGNEKKISKEWICNELNMKSKNGVVYNCDSEIISGVYASLNNFLRKHENFSKTEALDRVLEMYFTGSVVE